MKYLKLTACICCSLLLTAFGEESAIQASVKAGLKDPESAQFGKYIKVTSKKGETYACITVNAKNAMGGYVGKKQAVLLKSKERWEFLGTHEIPQELCQQVVADN